MQATEEEQRLRSSLPADFRDRRARAREVHGVGNDRHRRLESRVADPPVLHDRGGMQQVGSFEPSPLERPKALLDRSSAVPRPGTHASPKGQDELGVAARDDESRRYADHRPDAVGMNELAAFRHPSQLERQRDGHLEGFEDGQHPERVDRHAFDRLRGMGKQLDLVSPGRQTHAQARHRVLQPADGGDAGRDVSNPHAPPWPSGRTYRGRCPGRRFWRPAVFPLPSPVTCFRPPGKKEHPDTLPR